jgi:hypothetical protein
MRIVEDNADRLVIRARPDLAWLIAWPALAGSIPLAIWPSIVDGNRQVALLVFVFGLATLAATDFSILVEADKNRKRLSIASRWLWRRSRISCHFREVVSVVSELQTTIMDAKSSHAIVIRWSYGRRVSLRHASLFTNHDRIVQAIADAVGLLRTEHVGR